MEISDGNEQTDELDLEPSFNFDLLPLHVVGGVLAQLPEGEVAGAAAVSTTWLQASNRLVRKRFFDLVRDIDGQLVVLKGEILGIPATEEAVAGRLPLFRSYFILELLREEVRMVHAIARHILSADGHTFCVGRLVQEYNSAFWEAKRRNLPPWTMNDELTKRILRFTKLFIDSKIPKSMNEQLFGSRILDILDCLICKHYSITVSYQPERNRCVVDVSYNVRDPEFLSPPPDIAPENNSVPNRTDTKRILAYLINFVRINNRTLLREEQYYRELEPNRRAQEVIELEYGVGMLLVAGGRWLSKEPRSYHDVLPNPRRKINFEQGICEMTEEYLSEFFMDTPMFVTRGFQCHVQMSCRLPEAPLFVLSCWKRLKKDMYRNADIENWAFKRALQIGEVKFMGDESKTQDVMYRMACTMDVSIQANPEEVELYTLEMREPD